MKYCPIIDFVPNSHALGLSALEFIENQLYTSPGLQVVEFGSGRSTEIFLNHDSCIELVSIEHDKSWLEVTRNRLELNDLNLSKWRSVFAPLHFVNIPDVPLYDCAYEFLKVSYSNRSGIVKELQQANLVLVDGPSGLERRWLPLVLAVIYCPDGSTVLLDDLNTLSSFRVTVMEKWIPFLTTIRSCSVEYIEIDHGLLRLVLGERLSSTFKLPPDYGALLYNIFQIPAFTYNNAGWFLHKVRGRMQSILGIRK